MTDNNPITPPPELVEQWLGEYFGTTVTGEVSAVEQHIATQAARWGSDQELEACCEWIQTKPITLYADVLRAARRPKPPSLKEQALKELAWVDKNLKMPLLSQCDAIHTIRRALEQLDD
jgi:hypothetical protein